MILRPKCEKAHLPIFPVNSAFVHSSAEPQTIWCSAGDQTDFPFLFRLAPRHCPSGRRTGLPLPEAPPPQYRELFYHRKAHKKIPPKLCFQFLQHYIISIICVAKVIAVTFLISLFEH